MTSRRDSRVLLVCTDNDDPATGFAVRVKLIADSITRRGREVIVLRLPNILRKTSWAGTMPEGVKLIEVPVPPGLRLSFLIALSQLIRSLIIHFVATWKKVAIIQAENTVAGDACTYVRWSKTPIIVDIHGAVVEEAVFGRGDSFKKTAAYKALAMAERRCIDKADRLFVVAEPMLDHLKKKYPDLSTQKVKIIPVAADAIFFNHLPDASLREQLGFKQNDVVFVYSGGAQRYQCIEETLSIFSKVLACKQNVKLLILTIETNKFQSLIAQSFPQLSSHTVIKRLDKEEVASHLQIADLGFLLRHNDILNKVSCPTKFAEYTACGVSVIATSAAGHAPSLIEQAGTGLIVDMKDEVHAAEQILAFLPKLTRQQRGKCREMAARYLHWDQAVTEIEINQKQLINS